MIFIVKVRVDKVSITSSLHLHRFIMFMTNYITCPVVGVYEVLTIKECHLGQGGLQGAQGTGEQDQVGVVLVKHCLQLRV